jgi:hypothetical protein
MEHVLTLAAWKPQQRASQSKGKTRGLQVALIVGSNTKKTQ